MPKSVRRILGEAEVDLPLRVGGGRRMTPGAAQAKQPKTRIASGKDFLCVVSRTIATLGSWLGQGVDRKGRNRGLGEEFLFAYKK